MAEADIQANALAIHQRMVNDKAISTCEDCLCSSPSGSVLKWLKATVCAFHQPSSAARRLPYVLLPWLAFNYKLDIFCHRRWTNDIKMRDKWYNCGRRGNSVCPRSLNICEWKRGVISRRKGEAESSAVWRICQHCFWPVCVCSWKE